MSEAMLCVGIYIYISIENVMWVQYSISRTQHVRIYTNIYIDYIFYFSNQIQTFLLL